MARKIRRKSRIGANAYRQQLLERIKALVKICPEKGCWIFQGTTSKGYGRIDVLGRMVKAHHATYYAIKGRWPAKSGKVWLHGCDNPRCCFVGHGKWGTVLQNNRDRHAKGRTVLPSMEDRARGLAKAAEVRRRRLSCL